MTSIQASKDNLEHEFQNLMKSANSLINAATNCLEGVSGRGLRSEAQGLRHAAKDMAEHVGETVQTVRHAAQDMAAGSVQGLKERYGAVSEKVGSSLGRADQLVRDHPYMAVGALFVLGAAVSAMLRKR
jgi:ElaB/YqjD/DUF883 family membrane-anchored ribosome-binding protein